MLLKRKEAATANHGVESHRALHSEPDVRPHPEKIVSVLAVSPLEDDHVFLGNIFHHSNWHLCGVRCWSDALDYLAEHTTAVVICEKDLPDHEWKDALADLAQLPDAPLLIVTSRCADDHLWAEVLNLGGYDVLMKPFDQTEVVRVISLAWLNWKNTRDRVRREAVPGYAAVAGM